MNTIMTAIGNVHSSVSGFEIQIEKPYRPGLKGLSGFSHAHIIWLADRSNTAAIDDSLICPKPYTACDQDIGVFGSRSPVRPNPICMSVVIISGLDEENGILKMPFIDTMPDTPVLDIKPYFPASDRVESARIPEHFSHWPKSYEASAHFDWAAEFG